MNTLILGSGAREHAIVRSLKYSSKIKTTYVIPGNAGIEREAICFSEISLSNFDAIYKVVKKYQVELVIVGPEVPLCEGITDFLREKEILVFGPSKKAAALEGSKIFSKEFMIRAGIPTAKYKTVISVDEAMTASEGFDAPYVLKADGLAAGKGVFICKTQEELKESATLCFENKIFGDAGTKAILEEFIKGNELSFFVLTNGEDYTVLPQFQDHKRLLDNDEGPNTGGMGAIGPLRVKSDLYKTIEEKVIAPTVEQLKKENLDYKGVIYIGVIVKDNKPYVLEYNVRFGDPEAQILFPLLEGDWGEVFKDVASGKITELEWKKLFYSTVVLAAEGYPEKPVKDVVIEGDLNFESHSSYFLFAGVKKNSNNQIVTSGGRVINAIGLGSSQAEAVNNSYLQAKAVHWPKMQYRKDIGKNQL